MKPSPENIQQLSAACCFCAVDERRGSVLPGSRRMVVRCGVCELRSVWIFCVTVSMSNATSLQWTCRKWPALSPTSVACLSVPPESLQSYKMSYAQRLLLWADVRQRRKTTGLLFESSLNRVVLKVYSHFKCDPEIWCLLYALLPSPRLSFVPALDWPLRHKPVFRPQRMESWDTWLYL